MNWLRGEVTCTASDPICSEKEGSNKAERVWIIQKVDIYPHVHPRALDDCQLYAKYLFEKANTKATNSQSLRKAFYIHRWLFHFFFFFFFEAFTFTSLRFSTVEFYLHLFSLPIFVLLSSERAPKFSFSNIGTHRGLAQKSLVFRKRREPLSNVLAFREKMKKVTMSSKCIKNPYIYRADKQANSTT